MINITFNIRNPWPKYRLDHWWSTVKETPFKHKYIEMELYKDTTIVSLYFAIRHRTDHAGVAFDIGIFGYNFSFNFYDNRHYNNEEGRWMRYTEEDGLH